MSNEQVFVQPGQGFAGGVLTKEGAEQVNFHRFKVKMGEKPSVIRRLIGSSNVDAAKKESLEALSVVKPF